MYGSGPPGRASRSASPRPPDSPQRHSGAATRRPRVRFDGWIAGMGTYSGTRIVLGHWLGSPFGAFSDVMLERDDGDKLLLAPTRETADSAAPTSSTPSVSSRSR